MPDAKPPAVAEQVSRSRHGAVIFDAGRLAECEQIWFAPGHWRDRDAVRASARGRGTAWLVDTPIGRLFLRHYHRGGLVARANADRYLWTGLHRTRAFREFRALAAASALGLPVPAPVAGRIARAGIWYRADILTAAIDADSTLAERVLSQHPELDWAAVGRAIGALHRAGFYHADLNAHNVLFDRSGCAWIVDFDRARQRPPASAWRRANLMRLQRSLLKVGAGRRAQFFQREWPELMSAHAGTIAACAADEAVSGRDNA
jgi:3-deoxy-D-manno-octulosonic acid kinase